MKQILKIYMTDCVQDNVSGASKNGYNIESRSKGILDPKPQAYVKKIQKIGSRYNYKIHHIINIKYMMVQAI